MTNKKEKVNVLGTKYTIDYRTVEGDRGLEQSSGYCDFTTKEIVIKLAEDDSNPLMYNNMQTYYKSIIRHEIAHAFMYESGLDVCNEFARDEELIDWIAIQIPKMSICMKDYL